MTNHPNRKKTPIASLAETPPKPRAPRRKAHNHEAEYPIFEMMVRGTFDLRADTQLFRTDMPGKILWEAYMDLLPSHKQVHNCHACRQFIEKYGGLVIVQQGGMQLSVMWEPISVPEFYRPAVNWLSDRVKRANITGPFYSSDKKWGIPRTGDWMHLHVVPYPGMLYKRKGFDAEQATASKVQDFQTVKRALDEWTPALLDEAIRFLKADALLRSDKFLKPAQWLRELHDRPKGKYGDNVLWMAIANAPDGFCHPRSGMLGTLLDDLAAGKSFTQIKIGFDRKMGGLEYQRPKMMSEGNVAAAEKLVEKLGIARSLERRFARLDEVRKVWVPRTHGLDRVEIGVFSHLTKPRPSWFTSLSDSASKAELPEQTMTWVKFAATVLLDAEKIMMQVPSHGDFIATVTAVHADAPPILQWDREDDRYPVSQYRYNGGSACTRWNLGPGLVDVTAITPMPGIKDQVLCILAGCRDIQNNELALFPETLKSELHSIRSTIEAHSKTGKLSGFEEASACGLQPVNNHIGNRLRVFADGAWSTYKIDRWD